MLRLLIVALVLLVQSGCATPPKPKPAKVVKRKPPHIDVHVKVRPGQLDVSYRLPLAFLPSAPKTVDLRFFPTATFSKGGKAHYVDFIQQIDADGQVQPFPARFILPGRYVKDGALQLRYRVALTHHEAGPTHGLDDVPHPTARGWQLLGRAFLPQTILLDRTKRLGLRTRLTFSLPNGWRMTSTFDRADRQYSGRSEALLNGVYHVGDFARREVRRGETVVEIVSGDFTATQLAPIERLVGAALDQGERLLGKLGTGRLLVIVDKDPEGFQGGVIGGTVTITSAVAPFGGAMSPIGVVLTHELMHLWHRADHFWLHEGMTRYLELLVKLRVDGATPARAMRELLAIYQGYRLHAQRGRTIADARDVRAYDGGALVLFCADAELRAERKGTLLDVHRAVRALDKTPAGRPVAPLVAKTFMAELSRRSPRIAQRLRQRLAANDVFDVTPCLLAAGYAPKSISYRGYTNKALLTALGVGELTGFGLRVLVTHPQSLLFEGDVILAINGRGVTRLRELERVLGPSTGRTIAVKVLRRGRELTVNVTLPRLSDSERPLRQVLGAERTKTASHWGPF